jgi:hypothetical protein
MEGQATPLNPDIRTSRWSQLKALPSEIRSTWKSGGTRAVFKRFGWKLVVGVFVYYLIRDSILYLLIPYLVLRGLIQA